MPPHTLIKSLDIRLIIADGDLDDREEKLLQKIAKVLQLSTAHCKGIIAEIHDNEA